MYRRILRRMREKVRRRQYVMTLHAEEEMNDDGLSIFDVEHGILSGEIVEHQMDHLTGELKYRISGQAVQGNNLEIIAKISPTQRVAIITVYARHGQEWI